MKNKNEKRKGRMKNLKAMKSFIKLKGDNAHNSCMFSGSQ